MLHEPIILLSLLIISSNHHHGAVAGVTTPKPPPKPSILNEINNDINICDTPKIAVLHSNYVSRCNETSFSSANIGTPLNNTDAFLCLGLYDRAYQMCHSRSLEYNIPLLRNVTAFESLMSEKTKNETKVLLVCLKFETNMRMSFYNKTKISVDKLTDSLKDPEECVQICLNKKTKIVNPLCLIMQLIDGNIQKEELEKKAIGTGVKTVEPKANEGEKEVSKVSTGGNNEKVTGPKIGASGPSQPGNLPLNSPHSDEKTKHTEDVKSPVNDASTIKNVNRNESKPLIPDETAKNHGQQKEHTPQEQPPPLSTEQVTKKGEAPKKGAEPNNGDSVSQIAPPGKNTQEEKSSTVSENTGNDDFDPGMENNYDGEFHNPDGVPPEMDADDDVNSPPLKEVSSIKEKVPDSFQEANNVPKPPRLPDDDDSHFFGYFTIFGFLAFSLFLAYHHKHKIFAMLLEGRRSRGGRARRRPSTANYRKLDCTLEEAVTSQCSSNVTHVIY